MRTRICAIGLFALLLSGCDLIRMMLPRQGTTASEARAALHRCGTAPNSIAWTVSADGTFAFGRKSADAPPLPDAQFKCLMRWVEENRVKVGFIGWETGAR